MFYLSFDYEYAQIDDPRFIAGRAARIVVAGSPVGELGELHTQILENWSVTVPCIACELDLDTLLGLRKG